MLKLVSLFLFLSVSSFIAGETNSIKELSDNEAKVTATPTPQPSEKGDFACQCAGFRISSNFDGLKAGDDITFYAEFDSDVFTVRVYNWTVENGEIVSGQGTDEIVVKTRSDSSAKYVSATLQIPAYDTYCNCATTSEKNIPFSESSYIIYVDEFTNVDDLILDETELTLPPRPGQMPLEGTKVSPDMLIDVTTVATDPENDPLIYNYVVSGGRIIGKGAKVMWDLTGVEPGTYKITAGVDDGCGICGKTVTKTVEVFDLPIVDIECSKLSINGPAIVNNSSAVKFTAEIEFIETTGLTYSWSANNAEILNGKSSDTVTVRMPAAASDPDSSVTLKVHGLPFDWYCPSEIRRVYRNGQYVGQEITPIK